MTARTHIKLTPDEILYGLTPSRGLAPERVSIGWKTLRTNELILECMNQADINDRDKGDHAVILAREFANDIRHLFSLEREKLELTYVDTKEQPPRLVRFTIRSGTYEIQVGFPQNPLERARVDEPPVLYLGERKAGWLEAMRRVASELDLFY